MRRRVGGINLFNVIASSVVGGSVIPGWLPGVYWQLIEQRVVQQAAFAALVELRSDFTVT